jgi:hypothetical protein
MLTTNPGRERQSEPPNDSPEALEAGEAD